MRDQRGIANLLQDSLETVIHTECSQMYRYNFTVEVTRIYQVILQDFPLEEDEKKIWSRSFIQFVKNGTHSLLG